MSKQGQKLCQEKLVENCQGEARLRKGREGEEGEEERHSMENELMNAIFAKEPREMYAAEGEGTWKATSLIRSVQGRILPVNL